VALLEVRLYGDPMLRRKAAHVREVTPEIRRLIGDMVETMYHQVGIGLAAS
jgi:peptide deformylase